MTVPRDVPPSLFSFDDGPTQEEWCGRAVVEQLERYDVAADAALKKLGISYYPIREGGPPKWLGETDQLLRALYVIKWAVAEAITSIRARSAAEAAWWMFTIADAAAEANFVHDWPLIERSLKQLNALPKLSAELKMRVRARYNEKAPSAESKTACYRELAEEFDQKLDTIRYIIEGPRRRKA